MLNQLRKLKPIKKERRKMNIDVKITNDTLILKIFGQIDTLTAPDLENCFDGNIKKHHEVIIDFENVDYISSAGLRTLLVIQKHMISVHGVLTLTNINDTVRYVFDITGFSSVLGIK